MEETFTNMNIIDVNVNTNIIKNDIITHNNNQQHKSGKSNNESSSFDLSKENSRNSFEESSFVVTKRRRLRKYKDDEINYVENSPNKKYSRTDIKTYSEKYHIAYSGLDNDRGREIVWHELNVSSIDDITTENVYNEIQRLKTISKEDCLNTITDVWLRDDKRVIVIITECFGIGTLRQYLSKIGKQKLKVIKGWIINILRSLTFLHSANLIFVDLNCSRILFNGTLGTLAIRDLFVGSDTFYQSYNEKPYELFPLNCMCPELITTLKVNEKSDIYSLGMVIIEVITLEIPYSDLDTEKELMDKKIKGELPSAFYRIMDEGVKAFLMKMLAYEPEQRCDIKTLLNDDFLKITKDDYRIIKVKSGKYKKRKQKKQNYEGGGDEFNLKNYVLYKEFKEEPYNDEMRNVIQQKQRIVNNHNKRNNTHKEEHTEQHQHVEKEIKEYENLAAKYNSEDYGEGEHNGMYDNTYEYKIVDEDYNVHLKLLIKEEGKVNEIQFTYNLLKDSIDCLMEEIKREFNLSKDNLNHIYETLKKVHIYSKLCKDLELLPNNSC